MTIQNGRIKADSLNDFILKVNDCRNLILKNLIIEGNNCNGIDIYNSPKTLIQDCTFISLGGKEQLNTYGIFYRKCDSVLILKNLFDNLNSQKVTRAIK